MSTRKAKLVFPADMPDQTYNKLIQVIQANCISFTETECDEENSLTFICIAPSYYIFRHTRDVFGCQANVWFQGYVN